MERKKIKIYKKLLNDNNLKYQQSKLTKKKQKEAEKKQKIKRK